MKIYCITQRAQIQCSVITQDVGMRWEVGWDEVGGSRGLRERGHMYTYDRSTLIYGRNQYCKTIILQLKLILKRKEMES